VRLPFSQVATLEPWQGVPTLAFRMANARQSSLVGGRIRASVATEGQAPPLPLVRDQSITFQSMWIVMYCIDDSSPLRGLTPEDLGCPPCRDLGCLSGHR